MKLAAAIVVPFLLATFIATVTWPLVRWLRRRGLPGGLAVTVAMLADVAGLLLIATLVGRSIGAFTERRARSP